MSRRDFGMIFQIGDVLVSEDIITEYFACDYPECRGVCCIKGDSGAPLQEDECDLIERQYPVFSSLMSPEGRDEAERTGFFSVDRDGDLVTPTVPGREECAYVHFQQDGSAICSIERCYDQGLCRWCKPISCRLYPIRVTELTGGGLALNLHRWDICAPAYAKGRREGIRVYQFLQNVLTERFGPDFYAALDAAATQYLKQK